MPSREREDRSFEKTGLLRKAADAQGISFAKSGRPPGALATVHGYQANIDCSIRCCGGTTEKKLGYTCFRTVFGHVVSPDGLLHCFFCTYGGKEAMTAGKTCFILALSFQLSCQRVRSRDVPDTPGLRKKFRRDARRYPENKLSLLARSGRSLSSCREPRFYGIFTFGSRPQTRSFPRPATNDFASFVLLRGCNLIEIFRLQRPTSRIAARRI